MRMSVRLSPFFTTDTKVWWRQIVHIIGSFHDDDQMMLSIYMEHIPISLSDLLASPYFSPHPFPPSAKADAEVSRLKAEQFNLIAKSIAFQTLCALAFLHDEQRQIAHRDIKPANVMLTKEGCVKLIDFGVSFQGTQEPAHGEPGKRADLWPETKERLYFEVSTGYVWLDVNI